MTNIGKGERITVLEGMITEREFSREGVAHHHKFNYVSDAHDPGCEGCARERDDDVRRSALKHHLGYPNANAIATFVLGVPAMMESLFMLEGAMNAVAPKPAGFSLVFPPIPIPPLPHPAWAVELHGSPQYCEGYVDKLGLRRERTGAARERSHGDEDAARRARKPR